MQGEALVNILVFVESVFPLEPFTLCPGSPGMPGFPRLPGDPCEKKQLRQQIKAWFKYVNSN